jgi:predicted TIM-barrel fold metal-dependent hydrolase
MIIDADAHVSIPDDLFVSKLPASLRARAPRAVQLPEGRFWLIDGRLAPRPGGRGAGSPRGFAAVGPPGTQDTFCDNIPGRLADMDREGINVAVIYPELIVVNPDIEDPDVASAVSRVYNDHLAARCASAPDRLKRVAVVALQDPTEAARELRRAITELGCVGAVVPPLLGDRLLDHRDFAPFFEEANRLEAPIAVHAVTGVYSMPWQDLFDSQFGSRIVAMPMSYIVSLVGLFSGRMMEHYPKVRFAFLEAGCSWAPYWVDRIDDSLREREPDRVLASEYVRQGRIAFSCEPDEAALPRTVEALGDGGIMYASDYPHGDSKWPHTVSSLRAIPGLPEASLQRILSDNAARFYHGLAVPA